MPEPRPGPEVKGIPSAKRCLGSAPERPYRRNPGKPHEEMTRKFRFPLLLRKSETAGTEVALQCHGISFHRTRAHCVHRSRVPITTSYQYCPQKPFERTPQKDHRSEVSASGMLHTGTQAPELNGPALEAVQRLLLKRAKYARALALASTLLDN